MKTLLFIIFALSFLFFAFGYAGARQGIDVDYIKSKLKILRDLDFKNEVPWEYKNKDELREDLETDMKDEENKAEFEREKAFLDWMQLVPEKFDIVSFLSKFYARRIAGYYDPESKRFYLCREKSEIELPDEIQNSKFDYDKITSLHEMDHALQDQYFDLSRIQKVMRESHNDDVHCALLTLIEGDATYVTIDAIYKEMDVDLLTVRNLSSMIKRLFYEGPTSKDGETVPLYFSEMLTVPYTDGFEFVKNIICVGGWDMVNKIYSDLPDSTEQILHYEKYLFSRDFPSKIRLAVSDELPGGWKKIEENTMGEQQMRVVLNQFFPAIDKSSTHAGWGGDTYRLYSKDGSYFALWFTTWDTPGDAAEFFKTYRKILERKYKKLKINRETRGTLVEAEVPQGKILMEKRDKSVVIAEKVPQDIYSGVRESIWSAEITRPEHAIAVKASPDQIKIRAPSSVAMSQPSGGSANVEGNMYTNTYYGFSIIKPERWIFKTDQYNSSTPFYLADYNTGALVTASITESSTPLNETMMEYSVIGAGSRICNNFQKVDSGTENIGGYYFCFATGTGTEKQTNAPCEIRIYGADIKNRLFMIIYVVPAETAGDAEGDFKGIIGSIRFD